MEKIRVYGTFPDLDETAKRLGMSPEEVESVRRITRQVKQEGELRAAKARKATIANTGRERARQAS